MPPYAIEATVHAPSLEGVYGEIQGAQARWCLRGVRVGHDGSYDNDNLYHRKIRLDIGRERHRQHGQGRGCARCHPRGRLRGPRHEDLAERPDISPWYWPLDAASWQCASSIGDLLTTFRMTKWGRLVMHNLIGVLETAGLAPPGTRKTADSLGKAADALVLGGKEHLFTPMFLMVARKPLDS